MQIIKTEGKYRVYGENIEVFDKLEPDFYQFMLDDNGPFIVRTTRPTIQGKVYGTDQKKVEKCLIHINLSTAALVLCLSVTKVTVKLCSPNRCVLK